MKTISKNKYIMSNLAANEDETPGKRLVWIGEVEFLAFTMFFKCRFINLKHQLRSYLNIKNLELNKI